MRIKMSKANWLKTMKAIRPQSNREHCFSAKDFADEPTEAEIQAMLEVTEETKQ